MNLDNPPKSVWPFLREMFAESFALERSKSV